jgi:DNA-binding winged helix-turn-helix (wHTH) protein
LLSFWQGHSKESPVPLTFSDYCLDVDSRQLRRAGAEIRLSPKAFELLLLLVENRTRALSKAELHERLWQDTFVTDANLSVLVGELRRALHDPADAPRFIRTVRGFGYAFGAEVDGGPVVTSANSCWVVLDGREIPLKEGDNIIGRDPEAIIRLNLPSVSRRHARIAVTSTVAFVEDLGSKNGTFLKKDRIVRRVQLADLDELEIGSARLLVRILSREAPTQTLPGA